jgi:hypothetical protein
MTWSVLLEELDASEQPKLDTRPCPAAEQSFSMNLDNVHRKRQSTEQIQQYSAAHGQFHQRTSKIIIKSLRSRAVKYDRRERIHGLSLNNRFIAEPKIPAQESRIRNSGP